MKRINIYLQQEEFQELSEVAWSLTWIDIFSFSKIIMTMI